MQRAQSGDGPDEWLYGLNHLERHGFDGVFSDTCWETVARPRLVNRLHRFLARATGLGFNLGQAIQLRPLIGAANAVCTTADSAGLPVALMKRLGLVRTPLVYVSQGLAQMRTVRGDGVVFRAYGWLLNAADRVVYFGHDEGRQLQALFGVPEAKLTWVPIGVDTSYFRNNGEDEASFILSVGRDQGRNFALLAEAVASMPVKVHLVTSPPRLQDVSLPPNVKAEFDVEIQRVRSLYDRCRFVVIPLHASSYSMGGWTLLQAMSMSKAVVVTRTAAMGFDNGGYSLQHMENCWLVPPDDIVALREAVSRLWSDAELRTRMGRAARQTVEVAYSTYAFGDRMAAVLRGVLPRAA